MKLTLLAFFLSVTLFACSGNSEKTYSPRALAANETFDEIRKSKSGVLTLVKIDSNRSDGQEHFEIQYRDTTISIQDEKKPLITLFKNPRFVNSQNTAVVGEAVDSSAVIPSFYVISLKDGQINVVSLNKPSSGQQDQKYTRGLVEITRTNFVINNDFIVNSVNGRIYSIKRENPNERIQGEFLLYSKDKTTLVFFTKSALYQVNYKTGETETLEVPAKLMANEDNIRGEIAQNYSWATNTNGTPFLRYNGNPDRIVDIKEFKK